jgi:hypothetical protein
MKPPVIPPATLDPFQQTQLSYLSRIAGRLDDITWALVVIAIATVLTAWFSFTIP